MCAATWRSTSLGWFLPAVVAGAAVAPPGPLRRFLLAALLASSSVLLYVTRLGGDFMEWRFLTPISGVLYPAVVVGAAVLAARLATSVRHDGVVPRSWTWGAASRSSPPCRGHRVGVGAGARRTVPGQETIASLRRYTDPGRLDWRTAAKAFDAVLPPTRASPRRRPGSCPTTATVPASTCTD